MGCIRRCSCCSSERAIDCTLIATFNVHTIGWRCQTNWLVQRLRPGTGGIVPRGAVPALDRGSDGAPIEFILTRPIALTLLACIALAIYYSFKPKPWEGEAGGSAD